MSSEATENATAESGPAEFALDRDQDRANMKSVGRIHFVMVMGALTLWGAADTWAVASGWALAWGVAVANALIAAYVISSVLHEWGHYAGARLAGANVRVLEKPVNYFFMFDFPFEHNDERAFTWMSLGGILVPWALVLLVALRIPIDNVSRAMLLAVFVAQAVFVAVFELPVVVRAARGGDPQGELGRAVKAGMLTAGRWTGVAVGAVVFLAS